MNFFFYGTLLDGSDNPVAREVHRLLEPIGSGVARGALFAIPDAAGWFPALVAGNGQAHGRLYAPRAGFTAAELARLDAYEDFDPLRPEASLYLRAEVQLEDGRMAQAYLFNKPLPEGARAIPGGDFRAWLTETGLAQFTGLREA